LLEGLEETSFVGWVEVGKVEHVVNPEGLERESDGGQARSLNLRKVKLFHAWRLCEHVKGGCVHM